MNVVLVSGLTRILFCLLSSEILGLIYSSIEKALLNSFQSEFRVISFIVNESANKKLFK